jgi:hypothetical protein
VHGGGVALLQADPHCRADQDWSPKILTVSCDRYYEDGDARVWREIHSSADHDADLFVHTGDQVCG